MNRGRIAERAAESLSLKVMDVEDVRRSSDKRVFEYLDKFSREPLVWTVRDDASERKMKWCGLAEIPGGRVLYMKDEERGYFFFVFDSVYGLIRAFSDEKNEDLIGRVSLTCDDLDVHLSSREDVFERRRKYFRSLDYRVRRDRFETWELDSVRPGEKTRHRMILCVPTERIYVHDYWIRADRDASGTMSFFSGSTFLPCVERERNSIDRVAHEGRLHEGAECIFIRFDEDVDLKSLEKWYESSVAAFLERREWIDENKKSRKRSFSVDRETEELESANVEYLKKRMRKEFEDYREMLVPLKSFNELRTTE